MPPDSSRQVPATHGPDALRRLPEALRNVAYSAARHPGAATPECPSDDDHPSVERPATDLAGPTASHSSDLTAGANCQRYAYAVLGHFGLRIPPLRSAELWADTAATRRAHPPHHLDLVLFDAGPVPGRPPGYGAHVGVHWAPDQVLHLCREGGVPVVWSYADFAARPRYARFLGAKRAVASVGEAGR
ncbi:cell wall hydrolase [Streptomyces sp. NPDC093589]|uniref:cell wall hydrolase n=1 Tax=Streptomyces sp. NPDC093589 TaxID=3366043 RepID=UPI00380DC8BB